MDKRKKTIEMIAYENGTYESPKEDFKYQENGDLL